MGVITKDQIKETTTPNQVEQLVVLEKGTNQLKRIDKNKITGASYKRWVGILTQEGASAPTATVVLENTLG